MPKLRNVLPSVIGEGRSVRIGTRALYIPYSGTDGKAIGAFAKMALGKLEEAGQKAKQLAEKNAEVDFKDRWNNYQLELGKRLHSDVYSLNGHAAAGSYDRFRTASTELSERFAQGLDPKYRKLWDVRVGQDMVSRQSGILRHEESELDKASLAASYTDLSNAAANYATTGDETTMFASSKIVQSIVSSQLGRPLDMENPDDAKLYEDAWKKTRTSLVLKRMDSLLKNKDFNSAFNFLEKEEKSNFYGDSGALDATVLDEMHRAVQKAYEPYEREELATALVGKTLAIPDAGGAGKEEAVYSYSGRYWTPAMEQRCTEELSRLHAIGTPEAEKLAVALGRKFNQEKKAREANFAADLTAKLREYSPKLEFTGPEVEAGLRDIQSMSDTKLRRALTEHLVKRDLANDKLLEKDAPTKKARDTREFMVKCQIDQANKIISYKGVAYDLADDNSLRAYAGELGLGPLRTKALLEYKNSGANSMATQAANLTADVLNDLVADGKEGGRRFTTGVVLRPEFQTLRALALEVMESSADKGKDNTNASYTELKRRFYEMMYDRKISTMDLSQLTLKEWAETAVDENGVLTLSEDKEFGFFSENELHEINKMLNAYRNDIGDKSSTGTTAVELGAGRLAKDLGLYAKTDEKTGERKYRSGKLAAKEKYDDPLVERVKKKIFEIEAEESRVRRRQNSGNGRSQYTSIFGRSEDWNNR